MRFAATLLLLLSAAPGAAAQSVALLPAVGPASEDDRRTVDDALRKALRDVDDLDVLSPVATRDNLMSLAEMGLVCLPEDVPCLVKLGIVADVAWVLVPEVEKASGTGPGRTAAIEVGVIDVAQGKRARVVDAKLALDDDDGLAALARRAMGRATAPSDDPPDDKPPADDPPDDKPPDDPPPDAATGPSTGVLLAGIGGVVAGVSLVGAVVADLVFLNVITADQQTRKNMVPVGAVLWGTTALGAITAGVGAFLLSEEQPE